MKCPCCGAAELIHDTRDMPYTYKGENTTIDVYKRQGECWWQTIAESCARIRPQSDWCRGP